MGKKIPEEVTEEEFAGSPQTRHTHESYGMVSFSRFQGGDDNLFGSSIHNANKIEMKISRAEKLRSLNEDRYFDKNELISVVMSPAQFAEAITSMNFGMGVPCTIKHVTGERMADCPEANERQAFENEFKQDVKDAFKLSSTIIAEAKEILGKKSILKGDRERLTGLLAKLQRDVESNMPFVQSQFNEACDKTVTEAKAEVEASVLHAVCSSGLTKIAEDAKDQLIKRETKTLDVSPEE